MNIALIDNYDSFTYNLVHLLRDCGAEVCVLRNDVFELTELENFDKILISPGPGLPQEAGQLLPLIRHFAGRKPILGVCLGHQGIVEAFGGSLERIDRVFHGISSPCHALIADYLWEGITSPFDVGRYHSWVARRDDFPAVLEITAQTDDGTIMALRHRDFDVRGIQFHPESILTTEGKTMIHNWLHR